MEPNQQGHSPQENTNPATETKPEPEHALQHGIKTIQPLNPAPPSAEPAAAPTPPPAPSPEPLPTPITPQPETVPVIAVSPPSSTPTLPEAPAPVAEDTNHAGVIVLQWLTYALWGWTVLAMSILTTTVIANFVTGADTSGFTPYGIASVLVLLPLAAVCDVFYSKQEPAKKTGAASIVMVIHAVIFALFGIGALIAAAVSVISLFVSSGGREAAITSLLSALIIFVFYGATLLRTLNPQRIPMIRRFHLIFMVVAIGLIAILGIVGPVAHARLTRDDKLITSNLYTVNSGIESYVRDNKKLPTSLDDVKLYDDAQELVDRNLVDYKPNSKAPSRKPQTSSYYPSGSANDLTLSTSKNVDTTYYYELCVTYREESENNRYRSSSYNENDSDGYATYLSTSYHDKGNVCYKLKVTDYGY